MYKRGSWSIYIAQSQEKALINKEVTGLYSLTQNDSHTAEYKQQQYSYKCLHIPQYPSTYSYVNTLTEKSLERYILNFSNWLSLETYNNKGFYFLLYSFQNCKIQCITFITKFLKILPQEKRSCKQKKLFFKK